jgi:glyoxylase-like metal-dependent hydrolase (beta-lactamase superfamily II)
MADDSEWVPLPPVELVRPGLWSIPVPIPINPLRYVLVYLFETDRGPYIVDTGWNTQEAYEALAAGLGQAGTAIEDVQGVLVTHIHPDHYGLAGRVRAASGSWIGLHPADAALIQTRYRNPDQLLADVRSGLAEAGAPAEELDALRDASMPARPLVEAVEPDVLIEDGDRLEVPGWQLRALWTPGHSPGHLCFVETVGNLLLAGDHVLPRITPNIGYHPQSSPDPLGDFLASLDRAAETGANAVLPAHEHRFVGLTQRVAQLKRHHEERFAEVISAIERGVFTAWGVTQAMSWSRPWERIEGFMRRAALGEALAHLHALEHRGLLSHDEGVPVRWRLVNGGTGSR